jgi:phosphoadenosine phosphosulfate reductase
MDQDRFEAYAQELNGRYGDRDTDALLRAMITDEFRGRIAVLSSFGAEAAVMLSQVAEVDPATPILFIDTGKLFAETLAYRDEVAAHLGLTDVRVIRPDTAAIAQEDPDGELWYWDPDQCCALRKVAPLDNALKSFDAVISGRKRYHGALRQFMPVFEAQGTRIKIDPLTQWSQEQVQAEFARRNLPRHPLVAEGYPSIGCVPCTRPATDGDVRSGRWAGRVKTECGIHLPRKAASAEAA